uniref:Prostatic acid phosphatase-like n=1 Tax=Dermatophagoides pteronyssinus TaxID=6956 RepID=A0A6P6XY18_DERPT|nr:prostatic acid phosphatase-like [Dermatophagoides pteronyssinus]
MFNFQSIIWIKNMFILRFMAYNKMGPSSSSSSSMRICFIQLLFGCLMILATKLPVVTQDDNNNNLLLVQFVFRHGDRSPIRLYHNDPYKRNDFKEGLGELTNRGKQRMFQLGKNLRNQYQMYLDSMPIRNVHARSSSRKRCQESCALLLAGMFPPRNDQEIWTNDDNIGKIWQPIVINTVESKRDWLLFPEAECYEARQEETKIDESPRIKQFLTENQQFIQKLEQYTGTNFSHWLEIGYLYDTLTVEQEYFGSKYIKPNWIDQMGNDTIEKLKEFHDLEFSVYGQSKSYLKLRIGSLIKELIENINKTLNSKNSDHWNKHIYLYSTHDTLLGYLLSAIESNIGQPTYASGLAFELITNDQNQPFIRMYYLNGTDNFSKNLLGNNSNSNRYYSKCDQNCLYNDFIQMFSELIPKNIEQECSIDSKILNKNCEI